MRKDGATVSFWKGHAMTALNIPTSANAAALKSFTAPSILTTLEAQVMTPMRSQTVILK